MDEERHAVGDRGIPDPDTPYAHAALARGLADHGVDTVFGLAGDGNLFVVESLVGIGVLICRFTPGGR